MILKDLIKLLSPKTWITINKGDPVKVRQLLADPNYSIFADREIVEIATDQWYNMLGIYTSYLYVRIK